MWTPHSAQTAGAPHHDTVLLVEWDHLVIEQIGGGKRRLPVVELGHAEVAKAMDYMLKRWPAFARFLDDGRICLSNNKAELLRVLERPEVPLHSNSSERDLRPQVIRRKISGGTRSDNGRDCRDAFLGLLLTCAKLGISFWHYLGHRLAVPETKAPYLPDLVRLRSAQA